MPDREKILRLACAASYLCSAHDELLSAGFSGWSTGHRASDPPTTRRRTTCQAAVAPVHSGRSTGARSVVALSSADLLAMAFSH